MPTSLGCFHPLGLPQSVLHIQSIANCWVSDWIFGVGGRESSITVELFHDSAIWVFPESTGTSAWKRVLWQMLQTGYMPAMPIPFHPLHYRRDTHCSSIPHT